MIRKAYTSFIFMVDKPLSSSCVFYSVFNDMDERKGLKICLEIRFLDSLGGPLSDE